MHHHAADAQVLRRVFFLLLTFALVEIGVGFLINSIALQGDGWHMVLDALNYALLWGFAEHLNHVSESRRRSRAEALGGLISAVTLLPISFFYLLITGVARVIHPQSVVSSPVMVVTASLGLIVNLRCFFWIHPLRRSKLTRGAILHLTGDTLDSVLVVGGGLLIWFSHWYWIDGALAALIGTVLTVMSVAFAWDCIKDLVRSNGQQ